MTGEPANGGFALHQPVSAQAARRRHTQRRGHALWPEHGIRRCEKQSCGSQGKDEHSQVSTGNVSLCVNGRGAQLRRGQRPAQAPRATKLPVSLPIVTSDPRRPFLGSLEAWLEQATAMSSSGGRLPASWAESRALGRGVAGWHRPLHPRRGGRAVRAWDHRSRKLRIGRRSRALQETRALPSCKPSASWRLL